MSFSVVILSARPDNLEVSLQSLLDNEPRLPQERVIVVDDGAGTEEMRRRFPEVRWISGMSPFIFARNANIGINSAAGDVVLMNDDALLQTPGGLTAMCESDFPGVLSSTVYGVVCNPNQKTERSDHNSIRPEGRMLAFVCVYLPRRVLNLVGPLDERFDGYGSEDNDYCLRCSKLGVPMGVFRDCVVDHTGHKVASTFRSKPQVNILLASGRKKLVQKWPELVA